MPTIWGLLALPMPFDKKALRPYQDLRAFPSMGMGKGSKPQTVDKILKFDAWVWEGMDAWVNVLDLAFGR